MVNLSLSLFVLLVASKGLLAASETNDLNKVLSFVVSEMNQEGFFDDLWLTFINDQPAEIPGECRNGEGMIVNATSADASLMRVLDTGVLRIAVNSITAGVPYLYIQTPQGPSTDLSQGLEGLTGYDVEGAKEAVRRIGLAYEMTVEPEFVLIQGPPYFEPLVEALENEDVDIIWNRMGSTDTRADIVDFACPNYFSEYVIGTGSGISTMVPSVEGNDTVPLACIALFCTFTPPPPFELTPQNDLSSDEYNALLLNTTNGIDYAIFASDQLNLFIVNECPSCGVLETDPIASSTWAPSTKKVVEVTETPLPTDSPTQEPDDSPPQEPTDSPTQEPDDSSTKTPSGVDDGKSMIIWRSTIFAVAIMMLCIW